ncbi:hypothetical protein C0J52_27445 [Blattella germanica]|nr:hypothetical protein C0J52_27445 [Blattella germanica]
MDFQQIWRIHLVDSHLKLPATILQILFIFFMDIYSNYDEVCIFHCMHISIHSRELYTVYGTGSKPGKLSLNW